jgi:predicted enzyme related to lactoylglutathione lyase
MLRPRGHSAIGRIADSLPANPDAMLDRLREAGVTVDDHIEEHEYGRFGWASDPEGNRLELWPPPPGH